MAVGSGGSGAKSLVLAPVKFYLYLVLFLSMLSVSLAASFSELFTNAVGNTLGIMSEDADNIGTSFEEGQRAAAGTPVPSDETEGED